MPPRASSKQRQTCGQGQHQTYRDRDSDLDLLPPTSELGEHPVEAPLVQPSRRIHRFTRPLREGLTHQLGNERVRLGLLQRGPVRLGHRPRECFGAEARCPTLLVIVHARYCRARQRFAQESALKARSNRASAGSAAVAAREGPLRDDGLETSSPRRRQDARFACRRTVSCVQKRLPVRRAASIPDFCDHNHLWTRYTPARPQAKGPRPAGSTSSLNDLVI